VTAGDVACDDLDGRIDGPWRVGRAPLFLAFDLERGGVGLDGSLPNTPLGPALAPTSSGTGAPCR
jgi:hypothetical protein